MDTGMIQHRELFSSGRWAAMPFCEQMANIGSEVSRAIRWKEKGCVERMEAAVDRCLELSDFTVALQRGTRRRELLRAREVLCDFFLGENIYHSTADQIQRYYDCFAMTVRT